MTYRELLNEYKNICLKKNLEFEAVKYLIQELIYLDSATFLLKHNEEIEDHVLTIITDAVNKYINELIPVQYILGYTYFYGLKFNVNNNVLIPRSETEELVEHVINYAKIIFGNKPINICDIGTGSGAIAVSLAKENNFFLTATDISSNALIVAKENACNNDVHINFYEGDLLEPLIKNNLKFDILVSNPPYVASTDLVDPLVLKNEPHLALFADNYGMSCYEKILYDSNKILNTPNIILFEHGYEQKELMIDLIKRVYPNCEYKILKDINGKDRFTIIINK
jgi:release factor glutamine methyltransferase